LAFFTEQCSQQVLQQLPGAVIDVVAAIEANVIWSTPISGLLTVTTAQLFMGRLLGPSEDDTGGRPSWLRGAPTPVTTSTATKGVISSSSSGLASRGAPTTLEAKRGPTSAIISPMTTTTSQPRSVVALPLSTLAHHSHRINDTEHDFEGDEDNNDDNRHEHDEQHDDDHEVEHEGDHEGDDTDGDSNLINVTTSRALPMSSGAMRLAGNAEALRPRQVPPVIIPRQHQQKSLSVPAAVPLLIPVPPSVSSTLVESVTTNGSGKKKKNKNKKKNNTAPAQLGHVVAAKKVIASSTSSTTNTNGIKPAKKVPTENKSVAPSQVTSTNAAAAAVSATTTTGGDDTVAAKKKKKQQKKKEKKKAKKVQQHGTAPAVMSSKPSATQSTSSISLPSSSSSSVTATASVAPSSTTTTTTTNVSTQSSSSSSSSTLLSSSSSSSSLTIPPFNNNNKPKKGIVTFSPDVRSPPAKGQRRSSQELTSFVRMADPTPSPSKAVKFVDNINDDSNRNTDDNDDDSHPDTTTPSHPNGNGNGSHIPIAPTPSQPPAVAADTATDGMPAGLANLMQLMGALKITRDDITGNRDGRYQRELAARITATSSASSSSSSSASSSLNNNNNRPLPIMGIEAPEPTLATVAPVGTEILTMAQSSDDSEVPGINHLLAVAFFVCCLDDVGFG
jgi:hypothetical protein